MTATNATPRVGVWSEAGRLRRVMVCSPGLAHLRLTPDNCDALLFDDVLWVTQARRDHFDFAATMLQLQLQFLDPDRGGPLGTNPEVEDHAEVHQATGMVSVQAAVPLGQAIGLLQANAFAKGRPITAVARDVLTGRMRFSNDDRGRIHEQ